MVVEHVIVVVILDSIASSSIRIVKQADVPDSTISQLRHCLCDLSHIIPLSFQGGILHVTLTMDSSLHIKLRGQNFKSL